MILAYHDSLKSKLERAAVMLASPVSYRDGIA